MTTDHEIDRVLEVVSATLNVHDLDHLDPGRVQQLISAALRGEPALTVDDGGGLHDTQGVRIGAVRRTDSGEWIVDRQNDAAARADAPIPSRPHGRLRTLMTRLKVPGS